MLKKIGHIALIPVLLVSTLGMTINMHYCQNELYDIGIFGEAENCCTPKAKPHDEKAHLCHVNKQHSSECEDEVIQIEKVDNFVVSSVELRFENLTYSILFTFYALFGDFDSTIATRQVEFPDLNISPPGIQVVLSLLQTYLL